MKKKVWAIVWLNKNVILDLGRWRKKRLRERVGLIFLE
jgi:hypothetical protein